MSQLPHNRQKKLPTDEIWTMDGSLSANKPAQAAAVAAVKPWWNPALFRSLEVPLCLVSFVKHTSLSSGSVEWEPLQGMSSAHMLSAIGVAPLGGYQGGGAENEDGVLVFYMF